MLSARTGDPIPSQIMVNASEKHNDMEMLMKLYMKCRAKAGGRQSAQDGTGKVAKSAGSQIRRYNEV